MSPFQFDFLFSLLSFWVRFTGGIIFLNIRKDSSLLRIRRLIAQNDNVGKH